MPAVFGARHVPVVATFDVVEYRGSVVCMGAMWIIGVLRDVRKRIGKGVGDMIQVTLQRDAGQREVDIPDDLLSALEEIPSTKECFLYLSYTHKREHIEYINEEKNQLQGSDVFSEQYR